jgi:hypothetical protein
MSDTAALPSASSWTLPFKQRRRISRCASGQSRNGSFSPIINAKPLEDAVVELIAQIVTSDDGLRERIVAFVEVEAQKTVPSER